MKEACNQQNLNMPQIEAYIYMLWEWIQNGCMSGGGGTAGISARICYKGLGGGAHAPLLKVDGGTGQARIQRGLGGGAAPLDPRLAYNL